MRSLGVLAHRAVSCLDAPAPTSSCGFSILARPRGRARVHVARACACSMRRMSKITRSRGTAAVDRARKATQVACHGRARYSFEYSEYILPRGRIIVPSFASTAWQLPHRLHCIAREETSGGEPLPRLSLASELRLLRARNRINRRSALRNRHRVSHVRFSPACIDPAVGYGANDREVMAAGFGITRPVARDEIRRTAERARNAFPK